MRRLLLSLVTLAALAAACQADGDRKGLIVLPGMHDSFPYDAYDAHPIIGQTLRHPPAGTVPYGAKRYRYGAGVEEARRAGEELDNPVAADAAALERGKWAYDTFCLVCHGAAGKGDGPIIGRFPNPPDITADKFRRLADGHLFHVITFGAGIMAPYAVQLPDGDRWRVIHYLRELQGGALAVGDGDGAGGAGGDGVGGGDGGGDGGGGGDGDGVGGGGAPPQTPDQVPIDPAPEVAP